MFKMAARNGCHLMDKKRGGVHMLKTRGRNIYSSSRPLKQRILERWQLYLLLLIPLIFTFTFAYIPMGGLIIAFKKYNFRDGIFGSPWVGFQNFIKFSVTSNLSRHA